MRRNCAHQFCTCANAPYFRVVPCFLRKEDYFCSTDCWRPRYAPLDSEVNWLLCPFFFFPLSWSVCFVFFPPYPSQRPARLECVPTSLRTIAVRRLDRPDKDIRNSQSRPLWGGQGIGQMRSFFCICQVRRRADKFSGGQRTVSCNWIEILDLIFKNWYLQTF